MNAQERRKFKKLMKELGSKRGRHTELVSVYVPVGYDLNKITQHLQQEQGTAVNIKSASTRNNVIDALEKMIQHLKLYKQTPKNGLAAFSGNVSEREGQSDVKVWSIEPPVPLNVRIYRCDKTFVLDHLEAMAEDQNTYGLIVMDRRDADIAILKGKKIIHLMSTHSEVPGKMRAGGQSAPRFQRIREAAAIEHYKKVGEYVKEQFLHMKNLKGVIIGGPGQTKYSFADGPFITADVKKKIIGIKDLSYTGDFGLQELLEKSADLLAAEEVADEKKIVKEFLEKLSIDPAKVTYGEKQTLKAIEMGAVDRLLLSEALDDETIEMFEEKAEEQGTKIILISTDTREGAQLRDLGKIASILRYAV